MLETINTPYVKRPNPFNGDISNPIIGSYITMGMNRQLRRSGMKKLRIKNVSLNNINDLGILKGYHYGEIERDNRRG
tara:strand:+ start:3036 stop:3266 length:231 start_codon:yes stop_codon:yes gene_type:complete